MNKNNNEFLSDPFLNEDVAYNRLLEDFKKHNSLVVAVDFDSTVYPLKNPKHTFPLIVNLLHECQELDFKIVIFSASPQERHNSIREYCHSIGIFPKGINCDVVDWNPNRKKLDYSKSKIFFNILLDDRAGLASAYKTLRRLVDYVKVDKENPQQRDVT